jgi:hypothetical protein
MEGARLQLFEITQTVKGDPLGNALMDEVLTSCFDHAMGRCGALEKLVAAMNRLNSYLCGYAPPVSHGLFRGTPEEISSWAEQLASQILAKSEQ